MVFLAKPGVRTVFRRIAAAALIASTLTGGAAAAPAKHHWTTGPYLNLVTGTTTERFIIDGKGAERFDAENSWRCEPGQTKAACVVAYEQNEADGGGELTIIDLPTGKITLRGGTLTGAAAAVPSQPCSQMVKNFSSGLMGDYSRQRLRVLGKIVSRTPEIKCNMNAVRTFRDYLDTGKWNGNLDTLDSGVIDVTKWDPR
jgi:hypothetical protein